MHSVRRAGLLLFVLVVGIFLGTLGWLNALLIASPLFLVWFMLWDEKRFSHMKKKEQRRTYAYHE